MFECNQLARYGVATMSRLLKMICGTFANNDLQLKASYGFAPPCTVKRPLVSADVYESQSAHALCPI